MSLKNLKEFITLAKDEGVSSLKYQSKDEKYEVSFSTGEVRPQYIPQEKNSVIPPLSKSNDSNYHIVKSPFVGTFYASPSPSDPAFVKVGDSVNSGSVLCILEAMKIMNEIESDASGKIVEICVENESLVEFGQELFKIQK